eukprot:05935.XXX_243185_243349_1 [CDS] Oithona nana genome sequencing.
MNLPFPQSVISGSSFLIKGSLSIISIEIQLGNLSLNSRQILGFQCTTQLQKESE